MFGGSFSDYIGSTGYDDSYDPSDPLGLKKYRTRKLYPGGQPAGGASSRSVGSFFPTQPTTAPNSSPPKDRPGDGSEDGDTGEPGSLDRSSRGLAIMNLGLGIASGAATNDYAGGLARGIAGFTNTVQGERQAKVAEAAQRRKDERQAQLDELERRSKEATIAHVGQETEGLKASQRHDATTWSNQEQKRGHTPGAAAGMISAIEQSAGHDSQEAQQARALASLGEDVDLSRLAELHDKIIARSHLGEDAGAKLQGEIPGLKAQISAGVREDPAEAAARKRQELGYEGQRVTLEGRKVTAYERQTEKQANRDPSPEQIQDDIARETERVFAPMKTAMDKRSEDEAIGLSRPQLGPDGRPLRYEKDTVVKRPDGTVVGHHKAGQQRTLPPLTQADYDAARQAAELQARRNIQNRLNAIRDLRPTGKPGHYIYDPPQ